MERLFVLCGQLGLEVVIITRVTGLRLLRLGSQVFGFMKLR